LEARKGEFLDLDVRASLLAEPKFTFPPSSVLQRTLLTEGSNFKAIWEHANEFVDMNYLQSNDIAAILHTYGVEAARASIIAEVSGVFGVYAITINCELILDSFPLSTRLELELISLLFSPRRPTSFPHRRLHDARGRLQAFQPNRYFLQE